MHSFNPARSVIAGLVPAVALVSLVGLAAPTAHADAVDNNFLAALGEYASWGYFDYRIKGEGFDDGYQSVPVNWSALSPRKQGFFRLLSEITGESPAQAR